MQYLFSEGFPMICQFVQRGALVAFDYDGTLAPIVADRSRAHMRPQTRKLLAQVVRQLPTAVVTGRSRADAARLLDGIGPLALIGNHGIDDGSACGDDYREKVQEWRAELDERLEVMSGVEIEDNTYSLSVHYRGCDDLAHARDAVWRAASSLEDARLVGGKCVWNVLPADAPHKGDAVRGACDQRQLPGALYIGDDDTDEDVFALADRARFVTIRVGACSQSSAQYFLRNQEEVDVLLAALVSIGRPRLQPSESERECQ